MFGVLINLFDCGQQASMVNKAVFFFLFRFEIQEHLLNVNKSEIIGKDPFNENLFEIKNNNEPSKDENTSF